MSEARRTVRAMRIEEEATERPAAANAEVCPVCGSFDVRAVEPGWFTLELDRSAELREAPVFVEFTCRECGSLWR